jgi:hypothetical protein
VSGRALTVLAAVVCVSLAACSLPGSGPANPIPGSSRTFTLDMTLSGPLGAHLTTATIATGLSAQEAGRVSGGGLPCHAAGDGLAFILTSHDSSGTVVVDVAIDGGSAHKRGAAISVIRGDSSWSTFTGNAMFGSDGMSATLSGSLPGDADDTTEQVSGGWTCQG